MEKEKELKEELRYIKNCMQRIREEVDGIEVSLEELEDIYGFTIGEIELEKEQRKSREYWENVHALREKREGNN